MNKTIKIYIGLLLLLFVGAIIIEASKPVPIDWTPSYDETHKKPYGTFVLYNELSSLVNDSPIQNIKVTPYEYFNALYNWEDSLYTVKGTYLLIDNLPDIDEVSSQELLEFASQGNTIFCSSNYPPEFILDSLQISLKNDFSLKGAATLRFANPIFENDSIAIEKGLSNAYFSELDSLTTTVLGYQKFNNEEHINFIKVDYFDGTIYLHLQPAVFTNYHLLKKEHQKYAAAALSYIPEATIFFDSKNKFSEELGDSIMRYILKQPALRWAWFLALISLFIFIIFNAKRKQRVVPIINPLPNTTVDFTKTIGNLYYETKDHNNLIDKKISFFLERIRRVYYLDTQILDDKFVQNLTLKSGKDKTEIKKLIDLVANLRAKQICSENDLLTLNKAIENFYTTK